MRRGGLGGKMVGLTQPLTGFDLGVGLVCFGPGLDLELLLDLVIVVFVVNKSKGQSCQLLKL